MTFDGKAFGEQVIGIVKDYVGKALVDIKSQIGLLAERIDDIEAREPVAGENGADGINGKDGAAGANGKDADPAIILRMVSDAVSAMPKPRDGVDGADGIDGKSVSIDDLAPVITREVAAAVAKMPAPKDGVGVAGALIDRSGELVLTLSDGTARPLGLVVGKDGARGNDGAPGANGKDGEPGPVGAKGLDGKDGQCGERGADGQPGANGKDAPAVTKEQIATVLDQYIAANPPPKGERGEPGAAGANGKDAPPVDANQIKIAVAEYLADNPIRNGEDGKSIKGDEGRGIKSTFIDLDGNLVVTFTDGDTKVVGPVKGADGKNGERGEIGAGFPEMEPFYDGVRTFGLRLVRNGEVLKEFSWKPPLQFYQGVYKTNESYERGDVVTWNGSQWHCNMDNPTAKPGGDEQKIWTLAVKRGQDGKDGMNGRIVVPPTNNIPFGDK